jgi:hypothetical protein
MESSGLIILISSFYVVKYTHRRVLIRREKPRSPAFSTEALGIIFETFTMDIWYYLPGEERYPGDYRISREMGDVISAQAI